jgi:hypothetical protein
MEQVDVLQTVPGLIEAYSTPDFYFTTYLLTLQHADGGARFQIADILPFPQINQRMPQRSWDRYKFLITPTRHDCEEYQDNPCEFIKGIHGQYASGRTLVEPMGYMTKLKQLRALLETTRAANVNSKNVTANERSR